MAKTAFFKSIFKFCSTNNIFIYISLLWWAHEQLLWTNLEKFSKFLRQLQQARVELLWASFREHLGWQFEENLAPLFTALSLHLDCWPVVSTIRKFFYLGKFDPKIYEKEKLGRNRKEKRKLVKNERLQVVTCRNIGILGMKSLLILVCHNLQFYTKLVLSFIICKCMALST